MFVRLFRSISKINTLSGLLVPAALTAALLLLLTGPVLFAQEGVATEENATIEARENAAPDVMGVPGLEDALAEEGVPVVEDALADEEAPVEEEFHSLMAEKSEMVRGDEGFWNYAISTLIIRFVGIFVVLGILQVVIQIMGRIFISIERKAKEKAKA